MQNGSRHDLGEVFTRQIETPLVLAQWPPVVTNTLYFSRMASPVVSRDQALTLMKLAAGSFIGISAVLHVSFMALKRSSVRRRRTARRHRHPERRTWPMPCADEEEHAGVHRLVHRLAL